MLQNIFTTSSSLVSEVDRIFLARRYFTSSMLLTSSFIKLMYAINSFMSISLLKINSCATIGLIFSTSWSSSFPWWYGSIETTLGSKYSFSSFQIVSVLFKFDFRCGYVLLDFMIASIMTPNVWFDVVAVGA
ncbi:hypothetical protein RHMOL_Rhmol09G0063300 [Rhododendron molle]|uniref:Uncharacterized protein n=1 Tax=Rhododendron molle TaxID=49168 RepID=A0ACC0MBJ6_RHOML|nr:hypothetical protein RHMOL_Rhmol09G0063300 [Rhododendron molle]